MYFQQFTFRSCNRDDDVAMLMVSCSWFKHSNCYWSMGGKLSKRRKNRFYVSLYQEDRIVKQKLDG